MQKERFIKIIWEYYRKNKRALPWRNTTNPYYILVSEVMLQQTQVSRVLTKFPQFIKQFPTFKTLHQATLRDILSVWQGMGYNRRALYLKRIAKIVIKKYKGQLPSDLNILKSLPGIGIATAGSITAFAYNLPTVFVETNIRRVFIHHFFLDKKEVDDKEIIPLVEETLDKKNTRRWYFALMDYGAMLVKQVENPNKRSKHYTVQTPFNGSDRELRGKILQVLIKHNNLDEQKLFTLVSKDVNRIKKIINALYKEGLIKVKAEKYAIS